MRGSEEETELDKIFAAISQTDFYCDFMICGDFVKLPKFSNQNSSSSALHSTAVPRQDLRLATSACPQAQRPPLATASSSFVGPFVFSNIENSGMLESTRLWQQKEKRPKSLHLHHRFLALQRLLWQAREMAWDAYPVWVKRLGRLSEQLLAFDPHLHSALGHDPP